MASLKSSSLVICSSFIIGLLINDFGLIRVEAAIEGSMGPSISSGYNKIAASMYKTCGCIPKDEICPGESSVMYRMRVICKDTSTKYCCNRAHSTAPISSPVIHLPQVSNSSNNVQENNSGSDWLKEINGDKTSSNETSSDFKPDFNTRVKVVLLTEILSEKPVTVKEEQVKRKEKEDEDQNCICIQREKCPHQYIDYSFGFFCNANQSRCCPPASLKLKLEAETTMRPVETTTTFPPTTRPTEQTTPPTKPTEETTTTMPPTTSTTVPTTTSTTIPTTTTTTTTSSTTLPTTTSTTTLPTTTSTTTLPTTTSSTTLPATTSTTTLPTTTSSTTLPATTSTTTLPTTTSSTTLPTTQAPKIENRYSNNNDEDCQCTSVERCDFSRETESRHNMFCPQSLIYCCHLKSSPSIPVFTLSSNKRYDQDAIFIQTPALVEPIKSLNNGYASRGDNLDELLVMTPATRVEMTTTAPSVLRNQQQVPSTIVQEPFVNQGAQNFVPQIEYPSRNALFSDPGTQKQQSHNHQSNYRPAIMTVGQQQQQRYPPRNFYPGASQMSPQQYQQSVQMQNKVNGYYQNHERYNNNYNYNTVRGFPESKPSGFFSSLANLIG